MVQDLEDPDFTVVFRNEARHAIFVASSQVLDQRNGRFDAGRPGGVALSISQPAGSEPIHHLGDRGGIRATSFEAYARARTWPRSSSRRPVVTGGVVDLPFEFELERP